MEQEEVARFEPHDFSELASRMVDVESSVDRIMQVQQAQETVIILLAYMLRPIVDSEQLAGVLRTIEPDAPGGDRLREDVVATMKRMRDYMVHADALGK